MKFMLELTNVSMSDFGPCTRILGSEVIECKNRKEAVTIAQTRLSGECNQVGVCSEQRGARSVGLDRFNRAFLKVQNKI